MSGMLMDSSPAITRTFPSPSVSYTVPQRPGGATDLTGRSYVQRRRLTDVLNGITDARRRVDHFTGAANTLSNMEDDSVSHRSVVNDVNLPSNGNIGAQLELFYYGHDKLRSNNDLRTHRDRKGKQEDEQEEEETNQNRRCDDHASDQTMQTISSTSADGKQTTPQEHVYAPQHQQIVLPPLLSPAVWRDGDQRLAADPAFTYEPEVPLSDRPSPARRFPLLTRPKRYDMRKSGNCTQDKSIVPTQVRTLPVCPASNCRLISLSWDENFFVDADDQTDKTAKCKSSQTYGSIEVASLVYRNGFPKRRPIAARTKIPTDYHRYSEGNITKFHDEEDVVGYRRRWKETVKDKRRLNEDEWKRENTGLFMDHISTLLKTSKSPKNS